LIGGETTVITPDGIQHAALVIQIAHLSVSIQQVGKGVACGNELVDTAIAVTVKAKIELIPASVIIVIQLK
jgi:hypothetical protein